MARWMKAAGLVFAGVALLFVCWLTARQDAKPEKSSAVEPVAGQNAEPKMPPAVEEWMKINVTRLDEANEEGGFGYNLAHFAAHEGRVDVLEWAKAQGVDVDAKDNVGRTPMMLATMWGHADTARWLKEQGANINTKDNMGETPLSVARGDGIKEWLRANGAVERQDSP